MKKNKNICCNHISLTDVVSCCPAPLTFHTMPNSGWDNKYILQHRIKELEADLTSNFSYTFGERYQLRSMLKAMKDRLIELTENGYEYKEGVEQ